MRSLEHLHAIIGVSTFEQDDFVGAQAQVDFIAPGNTLDPVADDYESRLGMEVSTLYASWVHGIAYQGSHPGKDLLTENP